MTPRHTTEDMPRARTAPFSRTASDITSVGVVGLGYVGLPLALLSASRGFRVVGFDIDEVKVAQLARRDADYLSDEENARFKDLSALRVTADERDLKGLDAYIICVPTPVHENRLPDLRPLESAAAIVGRNMRTGSLVVVESTVSPGVCEERTLPILERESGLAQDDFYFAHCPERINPGDGAWNVRTIPRVIGSSSPEGLRRAHRLYGSLIDADIVSMGSIKEAEAVKMVENAFRDVNIAFANELAIAFDRAGIDLVNVIRGASTKPFGFMPFYPGCGVGGHCIPVDPYYLIRYGRENGFEHRFLIAARRINSRMPLYAVHVLEKALERKRKKLRGSTIALLGLAYKPDVPDMRESPGLVIRDTLIARGAVVRAFDPLVPGSSDVRNLDSVLKGTDAALIATGHAQFRALSPEDFKAHGIDVVVDGRNCLSKEAFAGSGVLYRGIGR